MLETAVSLHGKSPEAFRTISEVSAELEVPQHVLRFWESRFSQIRPVKRGGGRRYYRPEDVDLLRGIRTLLYSEGFTIKGVQKVLREHGARYVAEVGRGEAFIGPLEANGTAAPPRAPTAEIVHFPARLQPQSGSPLTEEQRIRLEILLAELLQMKGRVRAALSAVRPK